MFTRDRAWGIVLALFVLLIGFGCGAANRPLPRAHWAADADGVIRVTYRFPEPAQATNIHPEQLLAPGEVQPPTEAFKAAVRSGLQRWQLAAQQEGIPLTFIEVAPSGASAKVDWILARVPPRFAAQYFPWHRDRESAELGRVVVKVSPDLPPELLPGTVAHEAGHTLGLPEIDNQQALMNPSRPNATITGSDTAELARHYPTIRPL